MLSGWKIDSKRLGKRPEDLGQDKAHDLFAYDSPSEQDGDACKRARLLENRFLGTKVYSPSVILTMAKVAVARADHG
jgi:hypothetical protein